MKNVKVISVDDYIYEDNYIYFISSQLFIIGKYDLQSRKADVLVDYSQLIGIESAFARIIKTEHKIYCIPCYANDIYCYDLALNKYYSLNISEEWFRCMPKRKIIEPVKVYGNVYCICRSPHIVISIDTEQDTYEISSCQECTEEHDCFTVVLKNNSIEYPFMHNKIIRFDTERKEFILKTLFKSDADKDPWENIAFFLYDNKENIWFCNFKGEVFRTGDNQIEKIAMPNEFVGHYYHMNQWRRHGIIGMSYRMGKICFMLGTDYRVLQYNISDRSFIWSKNPEAVTFKNQEIYSHSKRMDERNFLLYSRTNNFFYIWNIEKGFLDKFPIVPLGEFFSHSQFLRNKCLNASELQNINLNLFLSFVEKQDDCKDNLYGEVSGMKIYHILSGDK